MLPIHWQPLSMLPTLTCTGGSSRTDQFANFRAARSARTAVTMHPLPTSNRSPSSKASFWQSMLSKADGGSNQPLHPVSSRP